MGILLMCFGMCGLLFCYSLEMYQTTHTLIIIPILIGIMCLFLLYGVVVCAVNMFKRRNGEGR